MKQHAEQKTIAGRIAREHQIISDKLQEIKQRMLDSSVSITLKADDFNWVQVRGKERCTKTA